MAVSIFGNQVKMPSPFDLQSMTSAFSSGNLELAFERAESISKQFPKHHLAWGVLGAVYRERGDNVNALTCLRAVADLKPNDGIAAFNVANTLRDLGRSKESAEMYRRALRLNPDLPNGHFHLGNMLHETGQLELAEKSFRRALKASPGNVQSMSNLAHVLQDRGLIEEALSLYDQAVALEPLNVALIYNRIDALQELGDLEGAERQARELISIAPQYAMAHAQLAGILMDSGLYPESVASYENALKIDPENEKILSHLIFALNYQPTLDLAYALDLARRFGDLCHEKRPLVHQHWTGNASTEVLRVGIVSPDLRNHPVGHFLEGVLGEINPERVCLVGLPTQNVEDDLTDRIRPFFKEWRAISGLSDQDAVSVVRELGLHIVLDLSGHTGGNRLSLFAHRMAPVQASWLGYFATTGIREMDYVIADDVSLPKEFESHFTEAIFRLPKTRLCFTKPKVGFPVNELPALSSGFITFGSTSNLLKINGTVIDLWSKILLSVPNGRLLLQAKQFSSEARRKQISAEFFARGVRLEQLLLEPPASRSEYFKTYNRIDICLDPFPYPGGTTTAEALWMGVPVLTLNGSTFLSKQGVGILSAVGLESWVAKDCDDYLNRAVDFSSDVDGLARIRNDLRQMAVASPLFDSHRFAKHLEDALWSMWMSKPAGVSVEREGGLLRAR